MSTGAPVASQRVSGTEQTTFRGQPALRWQADGVGEVLVALHGGQLLSWRDAAGRERLYLSPDAVFDGQAAIRGGVPVCWPQFNQRGGLPKHGFARNLPWQPVPDEQAAIALQLVASDATRALWPHDFLLRIAFTVDADSLQVGLQVSNTGGAPFDFTAALHSYLAVDGVDAAQLDGLLGTPEWDAIADTRQPAAPALRFGTAFDRVYAAAVGPLQLAHPGGALRIEQSPTAPQTVVWNPGPDAALPDMPAASWRDFLCVEAAAIDAPVTLAPGAAWTCWQRFTTA